MYIIYAFVVVVSSSLDFAAKCDGSLKKLTSKRNGISSRQNAMLSIPNIQRMREIFFAFAFLVFSLVEINL